MVNDRITEAADWRDGINAFREQATRRLEHLEAQLDMLMSRIKDLEEPPKAPHPPKKEEEMKL
tara:strand:+ start:33 stop:221 length:189 start_codon:yes stop_codon:yes gene_type:complete